jgi:peptide/nickel transport system permease protein
MTVTTPDQAVPAAKKTYSAGRWDSPWLNRKLLFGLAVFLAVLSIEYVGPLFWDTKLALIGSSPTNVVPIWLEEPPSATFKPANPAHPLGTESKGRDMLAVLLVGTPRSLRVGLIGAGIGMLVGVFLGFAAGLLGGWIDLGISTLADVLITIPGLAVLVVIASYVRQLDVMSMALVMALFAWPLPTRLIRSQVLSMRERGYIQMAQLSGASTLDIMFKEMMPNLMPYLAASFTGTVAAVILAATALETLGLGPTRIPTLGMTINNALAFSAIFRGMWWWWGPPIVMLMIIFISLFFMTIGLDEVANPRLRGLQQ